MNGPVVRELFCLVDNWTQQNGNRVVSVEAIEEGYTGVTEVTIKVKLYNSTKDEGK